MSIAWTIKGEAGKALDDTVRTVASLAVDSAVVDFRSLTDDILSLAVVTDDITTALLPELGQSVTIYRDGVQFFVGTVTSNPVTITEGSHAARVEASGPWWWMERINFTQDQTDGAGNTEERISYVFGTATSGGNLQTHIENAIDRAITLGVPMQRGTVATLFDVPRITLNQSTCGQALAELVRLVPDTMVWFDYSTSPPTINVSRRGSATTRTLDYDTGAITRIEIQPLIDLQVTQVRLPYVERNSAGQTVFNEQASGSATTGKVQILTVSGPELDTFLPNDILDNFTIQTIATSNNAGIRDFVLDQDPQWQAAATKHSINFKTLQSGSPSSSNAIRQPGYTETFNNTTGSNAGAFGTNTVRLNTLTAKNDLGDPVSITGKNIVLTTDLPEWIDELATTFEKVTLVGQIGYRFFRKLANSDTIYSEPLWWNDIDWSFGSGGFTSTNPNQANEITIYGYTFAIEAYLVNTAYASPTVVYRPADYSFIAPPANLAANLKAAQDWLPYEGDIEIVEQDAGGTRYRGCKINLTNSFSQFTSMGALVSSERLDIKNGTTTITLGQPPRLDFRTFVDRIRKTPQDNIVYI